MLSLFCHVLFGIGVVWEDVSYAEIETISGVESSIHMLNDETGPMFPAESIAFT